LLKVAAETCKGIRYRNEKHYCHSSIFIRRDELIYEALKRMTLESYLSLNLQPKKTYSIKLK